MQRITENQVRTSWGEFGPGADTEVASTFTVYVGAEELRDVTRAVRFHLEETLAGDLKIAVAVRDNLDVQWEYRMEDYRDELTGWRALSLWKRLFSTGPKKPVRTYESDDARVQGIGRQIAEYEEIMRTLNRFSGAPSLFHYDDRRGLVDAAVAGWLGATEPSETNQRKD